MHLLVIGAGFTGLTASYRLLKAGHRVTLVEREEKAGGLAVGFSIPGWEWTLEKHYHHWFASDSYAIDLIKEVGLGDKLFFKTPRTDVFIKGKIYPFTKPVDILRFTPLSPLSRLRLGVVSAYLKLLPPNLAISLENASAYEWLRPSFGQKIFNLLWKPLLAGKFGPYADKVNMAWFWARIYKRTPSLGYLEGGYQALADRLDQKIREMGGETLYGMEINHQSSIINHKYNAVVVTTPSPIFVKLFPTLPKAYVEKITSTPHLHALNLLLITNKPILNDTYWLNINDASFPFIALVQHTNFVEPKHYGGNHILYIGNYLPPDHPFLSKTADELLAIFEPYLQKINPEFRITKHESRIMEKKIRNPIPSEVEGAQFTIRNFYLFKGPFAQPVMTVNYSKRKPSFETPLPNVYLANMDMVYPWDRGTNYAIELGNTVVQHLLPLLPASF